MKRKKQIQKAVKAKKLTIGKGNIFVFVKMFRGIHDGIELYWKEDKAEKAYKKYTGQAYPQGRDGFENIHEDYRDCIISEAVLP